jgi:NADH-quinone oxidoreductase subunit D
MREFFPKIRGLMKDINGLLRKNRIFVDRLVGTGVLSREDIISYGITGPLARAAGVEYDVRKAHPYLVYDRIEFDVPIGEHGDNYDRFLVRVEEIEQSLRIVERAMAQLPGGPISVADPRVILPPKDQVYDTIEGMIHHFKLIIDGPRTPPGEVYFPVEAANGELGFYIVSDGGGKPYRCRVRPPCLPIMAAFPEMIQGHMLADVIATFGLMNIILGELDR